MITAGTYIGTGTDQDKNAVGLPYSHALTVLGTLKVTSSTNGTEHHLVKIRNPWGQEFYNGNWSDKSFIWTDDLLE